MKNLFIAFLIALCGLLIWKLYSAPETDQNNQETPIAKAGKNLVSIEVEKVNKTVDEKGFKHALIEDKKHVLGKNDKLDDSSQMKIDTVLSLLDISYKQLDRYTSIIANLRDSLKKATNHGDSLWTYKDDLASISFNLPNEQFYYSFKPKIEFAEYWKRKWFLAPKRNYIDVWIPHKQADIDAIQRLRIEPRPDPFDLTLKGSAQYHRNDIGLGGKLNIRVGRVTGSGSYLYYPRYGDWKPAFSLDYDIGGL